MDQFWLPKGTLSDSKTYFLNCKKGLYTPMESDKIDLPPKISPSGSPRLDFKSKAFILQKIISYLFKIFLLQDNIIPIITHTEF